MELAGDAQALLFLGVDDLGGEGSEALAVLVELIEHGVEGLAEGLDLRVAERIAWGGGAQAAFAGFPDGAGDAIQRAQGEPEDDPVHGDAEQGADGREDERDLPGACWGPR